MRHPTHVHGWLNRAKSACGGAVSPRRRQRVTSHKPLLVAIFATDETEGTLAYTKEQMRAYQRDWCRKRRAQALAGRHCERCESTDKLEIHHRDPAQKTNHRIWSWKPERIQAELEKCEILCRDCHKEHHAAPLRRHGTRSRYRHGCRCDLCKHAKAVETAAYRARKREAMLPAKQAA